MPKLTEEKKADLEDELFWCREHLKPIVRKINHLKYEMNNLRLEHYEWKERFEAADRKYAFGTKLTICSKKEKMKKGVVKALEEILNDKDRLKSFIKLLEDEGGELK